MISKDFNKFKESTAGKYVMYGVYILVIVAIVIVIIKIVKGIKDTTQIVGDAATDALLGSKLSISAERVALIRTTAQTLWDKHTHTWLGRLLEGKYDTSDFVTAVNKMANKNEVVLLNNLYQQDGGDSLKDVITFYNGFGIDPSSGIDPENWATIQSL